VTEPLSNKKSKDKINISKAQNTIFWSDGKISDLKDFEEQMCEIIYTTVIVQLSLVFLDWNDLVSKFLWSRLKNLGRGEN
jgi:hypothetical protein